MASVWRTVGLVCLILLSELAQARGSGVSRATDGHALLQRGVRLHREAAYAPSVAALEQARATGVLDATEQAECGFYLAAGYLALSSLPAARRELKALLEAQPGYELPLYTSPKVAALYREVRDELERAPRLRPLPPRRRSATRMELAFQTAQTGGSVYGAAFWRWRGEREFHEAPFRHAGEAELVASIDLERGGTIEYFAEARGPSGLAQAASRERPLELPCGSVGDRSPALSLAGAGVGQRQPIVRAWWLWTSVGVALAGAGVGLYFGLR